jgi:hypothetical protein
MVDLETLSRRPAVAILLAVASCRGVVIRDRRDAAAAVGLALFIGGWCVAAVAATAGLMFGRRSERVAQVAERLCMAGTGGIVAGLLAMAATVAVGGAKP